MSAITQHAALNTSSVEAIPLSQVLPWAVFGGIMMLLSIYFVGVEEGAMSVTSSNYVHEYVHDARHLLGFPCH
jgi:cobalt transporter subunit CbtB